MNCLTIVDTERDNVQALDRAVECILTDRRLGHRAASQNCFACKKWFKVNNLEFIFNCSLETDSAGQTAVGCVLKTRYVSFQCPTCGGYDHLQTGHAAEAVITEDEEQTHSGELLSPEHVQAVYTLQAHNGTANLDSLQKAFIVSCPDCGDTSHQLRSPDCVRKYIDQHNTDTACPTLQQCYASRLFDAPASYGSTEMHISQVEDLVSRWMSRILVVVALHIAYKTRPNSSDSDLQMYMPWRDWAIWSLTEDTQLLFTANWVRPSLTGFIWSPRHNLLDMILAPPHIAAGDEEAGMTAHKLAVLLRRKHNAIEDMRPGCHNAASRAPLTLENIRSLLESMLSADRVFKCFPEDERVNVFLSAASIGSIEDVVAAMTGPYAQKIHLKICPSCGQCDSRRQSGCSYCIMCLPCQSCQPATPAATRTDSPTSTDAATETQDSAAAAAAADLCPWCQGHDDSRLHKGCLRAEQLDSLNLSTTAGQRRYFTETLCLANFWRFDQCLPHDIIKIWVKRGTGERLGDPYYVVSSGEKLESGTKLRVWLSQQPEAADDAEAATAAAVGEAEGGAAVADGDTTGTGQLPDHDREPVQHPDDQAAAEQADTLAAVAAAASGDIAVQQHSPAANNSNSSLGDLVNTDTDAQDDMLPAVAAGPQLPVDQDALPAAGVDVSSGVNAPGGNPAAAAQPAASSSRELMQTLANMRRESAAYTAIARQELQQQTKFQRKLSPAAQEDHVNHAAAGVCSNESAGAAAVVDNRPKRASLAAAPVPAAVLSDATNRNSAAAVPGMSQQNKRMRTAATLQPVVESQPAPVIAASQETAVAADGGSSVHVDGAAVAVVAAGVAADVLPDEPATSDDVLQPHSHEGPSAAVAAEPGAAAAAEAAEDDDTSRSVQNLQAIGHSLVRQIEEVLYSDHWMSHLNLESGIVLLGIRDTSFLLKKLLEADPLKAILDLKALHQLVMSLSDSGLVSVLGAMPLLAQSLMQMVPEQRFPGKVLKEKCTVLKLLLLCWSNEIRGHAAMAATSESDKAAAAEICQMTLQVLLKAIRLAAQEAAGSAAGDQDSSTATEGGIPQLSLQLMEGLSRLWLRQPDGAGHQAAVQQPASTAVTGQSLADTGLHFKTKRRQWQFAMQACYGVLSTLSGIVNEVSQVLEC